MRNRVWLAALFAALTLTAGQAWGGTIDISQTTVPFLLTSDDGVIQGDADLSVVTENADVETSIAPDSTLYIGASMGGLNKSQYRVDLELKSITTSAGATVSIESSDDTVNGTGTSLKLGTLDLSAGGNVSIGDGDSAATGRNTLSVGSMTTSATDGAATAITIGKNAELKIIGSGNTLISKDSGIVLQGGVFDASAGGLTAQGGISGSGTVKGNVLLNRSAVDNYAALISVDADTAGAALEQIYTGDLAIGENGGSVSIIAGDNAGETAAVTVQGTLKVGSRGIGLDIRGSTNAKATLQAKTLVFEPGAGFGQITMGTHSLLKVTGSDQTVLTDGNMISIGQGSVADFSAGGLRLETGSAISGNGSLALGSSRGLELAGGKLGAPAPDPFVITGDKIRVSADGTVVYGNVVADDAGMTVARSFSIDENSTFTVKNVASAVSGGTATITGVSGTNRGKLIVTENAAFAGAGAANNMVVSANLDIHKTGSFGPDSAFVATAAADTITLGAGAADSTLTLKGGAIDAGARVVTLAKGTTGAATFATSGAGSRILGDVDATALDARFNGDAAIYGGTAGHGLKVKDLAVSGGSVTLGDASRAGHITATAGDIAFAKGSSLRLAGDGYVAAGARKLDIKNGAVLDLGTNTLTVAAGAVNLAGTLAVDGKLNAGALETGTLAAGAGAVALGSGFKVAMGSALNQALSETGPVSDKIVIDGVITQAGGGGAWNQTVSNLYGDFGFSAALGKTVADGGGLRFTAKEVIDITDANAVHERFRQMYRDLPIPIDLALVFSGIAVNQRDWPENSAGGVSGITGGKGIFVNDTVNDRVTTSGYNHYHFLLAMAEKDMNDPGAPVVWQVRDRDGRATGRTGAVDASTLALYGGYAATTTVQVGSDIAFEGMSSLNDHVFSINQTQYALYEQGHEANASFIMNEHFLNRVWVGGFGLWADADKRNRFAGYKYDGGGFMAGYDRALGAFTVGGAFHYSKGEYQDKSAAANDSDIESYGFNLYANFNHHSGIFATAMGGFTFSDNDLRDRRGGGWTTQKFDTDTWNAGGKLGYNLRPADAFTVTPSVGLAYVHAENEKHNVNWGGVADFLYGRARQRSFVLPVDLRLGYDIAFNECSKLNLNLNLGYAYSFKDDGPENTVTYVGLASGAPASAIGPIAGLGRTTGRHRFNVGGGLRYTYGRFDVGANYDYYRKSNYDAHRVHGTAGISF